MRQTRRRYELRRPELDRLVEALVEEAQAAFGNPEGVEYVRQVVVSALGLLRDRASPGDLKLVNSALKELRHSFRVFAPYAHIRKVAVFGSARTAPEHLDWEQARAFGERLAAKGWMVITGAGPGIMSAVQGGAGVEASFGVNIVLPFEQRANEVIAGDHKLINFRYFFTRKLTFVKEAHAIALFPGGFGTLDEGFEALTLIQTGKSEILPVVFVDAPGGTYWKEWREYVESNLRARGLIAAEDMALFKITDDVEAAVAEILRFYANYHSSRYVGDRLVIRLRRAPDPRQLEELNADFRDILAGGTIEVGRALPEEGGEDEAYPRVLLRFNRRDMGRLRILIDRLNSFVPEGYSPPAEASPHEIVEEPLPPEAVRAEERPGGPGGPR
jgi:hypothetical protein